MANAVEKLFGSVLSSLSDEAENIRQPPELGNEHDYDAIDEPPDSDNDQVITVDEEGLLRRATDVLAEGRHYDDLSSDDEELLEGGVRHRGFDVLAFYKSRRFIDQRPYVGRWGIFYLKHGLTYLSVEIEKTYPGYNDPRVLAYEFLREHERFHYRADLQTLMFEATTGRHLHKPTRDAFRGRRSCFVEEALANRQAWDWAKKRNIAIADFAYDFMKLQPNAYSRFDESRLNLCAEWAANVVGGDISHGAQRGDLAHWVEATPPNLLRPSLCPEYFVRPASLGRWLPSALVLPPVSIVIDGDEVAKRLSSRLAHMKGQWERTKQKLIESRLLRGLNFKPWPNDGRDCYSVRVDDNFRAHLRHEGGGRWIAYILGPHKELGHG
jgi:hypothetical protein